MRTLYLVVVAAAIVALSAVAYSQIARAEEPQQGISIQTTGRTVIVMPEQTITVRLKKKPACDRACVARKEAEQQHALDDAMEDIVSGKLIACGYQEPGRLYVREPGPVGGVCWPVRFELVLKKWQRAAAKARKG